MSKRPYKIFTEMVRDTFKVLYANWPTIIQKIRVKIILIIFMLSCSIFILTQSYLSGEAINPAQNVSGKKSYWKPEIKRRSSPENLHVFVLNVGQGDSIFIEFPYGETMLIDAGSWDKKECDNVIEFLTKYFNDKNQQKNNTIDIVIATHPDEDYIGFLKNIVEKKFDVNWYIDNGQPKKTGIYQELMGEINKYDKQNKLDYISIKESDFPESGVYDFDENIVDIEGVEINVLGSYVPKKKNDTKKNDTNNSSIVLKIIYNKKSILLMGDAGVKEEKRILDRIPEDEDILDADVLKVGHHGSETSSSEKFLERVTPDISIISVGNHSGKANQYGHPNVKTLHRLETITNSERKDAMNIKAYNSDTKEWESITIKKAIYITSFDHNIVVKHDGSKISVEKLKMNEFEKN